MKETGIKNLAPSFPQIAAPVDVCVGCNATNIF